MNAAPTTTVPDPVRAVIRCGDGIAGLRELRAGAATLCVTDPPWGATQAPWDRPLDWAEWWASIDHVLAPRGILAVFASVRVAVEVVPRALRRFAYDMVWRKNRASGHLNARRAPLRAHELLLVFGDNARGEAVYTPQFTDGHPPMHAATRISKSALYGRETVTSSKAGTTVRYATSVLDVDVVPNGSPVRIHSTQKPIDLLRWVVRAFSRPGDLVVDPACGSGALMHAARVEGRRSIGWEIDAEAAAKRWLAGEVRGDRARIENGRRSA